MVVYLLVANAIIGLILFEIAWKMTAKLRIADEERDKNYPSRRRLDIGKPQKWRFYPGALTILLPRILLVLANMTLTWIIDT